MRLTKQKETKVRDIETEECKHPLQNDDVHLRMKNAGNERGRRSGRMPAN